MPLVIDRITLFLLIVAILLGCNSRQQNDIERNRNQESQINADICSNVDLAIEFMNSYTEYCTNVMRKKDTTTFNQWVKRNKLISQDFKHTYDTLTTNAIAADPEMGLGFDPILDAQDYPDSGFVLAKCEKNSQYVVLKGKDWPEFKVAVKLLQIANQWYVDGAGVINIPAANRAKR